jgi:hypothetical protein
VPLRPDRSATGAVGRRAVVTGLAGASVLALAGCAGGSPDNDLPGTSEAQQDADLELVDQAILLCERARQRLTVDAGSGPLRARLEPLVAMHHRHVDALAGAFPDGPSGSASATAPPVPPTNGTIEAARALEAQTRAGLVALAQRAQSGALARLLASMAAGISQRLVALR